MNDSVVFTTDSATLAMFDPAVLASRVADAGGWWCGQFHGVPEVAAGQIALFGLGADGAYKVRVTDQELTAHESAYATALIRLGIEVQSGRVFLGPGECLPGDGSALPGPGSATNGNFVSVVPGQYWVSAYAVEWQDAPDWFSEDDQPAPMPPPADVVLQLSRRTSSFVSPASNPRLLAGEANQWLFPEMPRRLGPVPGMVLSTSVALRRDDLVLKPCGPAGYRPILTDMSGLRWRDRVRVRVQSVNHDAREFACEIVQSTS